MEGLVCPDHDGWMERVVLKEGKVYCGKAVTASESTMKLGDEPICGKELITEAEYDQLPKP